MVECDGPTIVPTVRLPRKPSALIRLALKDLEACEADPNYEIAMGVWHTPKSVWNREGPCVVCLAGSVMAKTLACPIDRDLWPEEFDDETGQALEAIDLLRVGEAGEALRVLGLRPDITTEFDRKGMPQYRWNDIMFKTAMAEYADFLEKAGY